MNNLEQLSYDTVINRQGIVYSQFRKNMNPRYNRVWIDIFSGYIFLLFPFFLFLLFHKFMNYWWVFPFCAIWFGYFLAYVHLFIHEAAHFNIHSNKRKNDLLANLLLCSLFGMNIKNYRLVHWQHHLNLATPDDREISYFNALSLYFLLKVITGIHTLRIIFYRKKVGVHIEKTQTSSNALLRFIIFHLIIIFFAFLAGGWGLILSWVIGVSIIFPTFATLRQILEHRDEHAARDDNFYKSGKKKKISRIFIPNILSSSFGAAGFNKHLIHHWDPHISYTRLNDVLEYLMDSPQTKHIIANSQTTYFKVFFKLFHIK